MNFPLANGLSKIGGADETVQNKLLKNTGLLYFTLKQHPMADTDLEDFFRCHHPENRCERTEIYSEANPEGRFRKFTIGENLEREKTSLDIFWIKDKSLADLDNLPSPEELADEIIENLQSTLDSFQEIKARLG